MHSQWRCRVHVMYVQSTTKKKQRKKKLFLNFQKRRNQEEAGLGVPCISFYFTEFPPSTLLVFKKECYSMHK